jgi:RNA polymerase sigma-70 factor (ECF subfamily)
MMDNILVFTRPPAMEQAAPTPNAIRPPTLLDPTQDSEQWAAWMLLAQDGDRDAYQSLLKAVSPYVRAITRRYLGRGEDAEDAVQDVLMIVHGIRHTYERGRPFKPWLGTLATRRCIDLLRRRSQRMRHELESEGGEDDARHGDCGPEEAASRERESDHLHQAVAALPERQREAIRLLRLNELSLGEASAESDQSIGSLKVACHRAIRSLHIALVGKGNTHD